MNAAPSQGASQRCELGKLLSLKRACACARFVRLLRLRLVQAQEGGGKDKSSFWSPLQGPCHSAKQ